jgi:hypothetical protein
MSKLIKEALASRENDIKKEFAEAFASGGKDGLRQAVAEFIVEYINPGHVVPSFTEMLLGTRQLAPGDTIVKRQRKYGKVYNFVPGSTPIAHEISVNDTVNYAKGFIQMSTTYNEWDLINGNIGTLADIISEMMNYVKDHYQNQMFASLAAIWTAANTPDNYATMGGVQLTANALRAAIDRVNETAGGVRAVVGLRSVLTPTTTFGNFNVGYTNNVYVGATDNVKEIMETGWLGQYYGAPIVALRQQYNNPRDHAALLPTDKVLVIGEDVGEFLMFGGVKQSNKEIGDIIPPQYRQTLYQEVGMFIDNAEGLYLIDEVA